MGSFFVGQQPLAESPMKDHPLTPMCDNNLIRLLTPQVTRPVGLCDTLTVARGARAMQEPLANLANKGISHVVTDAVSNEYLHTIATACRDMTLLTGGSAIAIPLHAPYAADGQLLASAPRMAVPETPRSTIVLSGS